MTKPVAFDMPPDLQALWAQLEQENRQATVRRAKADPAGHKLSRVFSGPMRWRFYESKAGRSQCVRFCWSTTRNCAGYFLTWVETHYKKGTGARRKWSARRQRQDAKAIALRRFRAHQARSAKPHEVQT